MAAVSYIDASAVVQSLEPANLEKIESFLNSSEYREAIESSSTYNSRLCSERRMRIPWLDSQTGVAQNHSALLMSKRQRMPPLAPGQIYTYPRARWRKKRRQYLILNSRMLSRATDMLDGDSDLHSISQMENPALQDTDSKDSQLKDDAKDWYFDEQDMLELEGYDEPDPDSDADYEESSYSKRKNRRRAKARGLDSPSTPRRGKGSGRGRKKTIHNFEPTPGDNDKPFACDLCSARYKTRPGLTYHYTHSHRDPPNSDENSRDSVRVPTPCPQAASPSAAPAASTTAATAAAQDCNTSVYQDSYVTFLNHPTGTPGRRGRQPNSATQSTPSISQSTLGTSAVLPDEPPMPVLLPERKIGPPNITDSNSNQSVGSNSNPQAEGDTKTSDSGASGSTDNATAGKEKAAPSPYCDFCLGDARENKKTGTSEELVSCSDCGRSGHPTCLQFTANMIISVRKYRWQCIECKCCSICGTSDNDDQLLFCDDCDRGYHMYCLNPPLTSPPEGSWSCKLCLEEFHK